MLKRVAVSRRVLIMMMGFQSALLAGCDLLGIESPEKVAAVREAEGRAIGGACRHAGRAIEDCYAMNRRADKAAVFSGWREMNDYMRENKMEAVAPELAGQPGAKGSGASSEGTDEKKPGDAPEPTKGKSGKS